MVSAIILTFLITVLFMIGERFLDRYGEEIDEKYIVSEQLHKEENLEQMNENEIENVFDLTENNEKQREKNDEKAVELNNEQDIFQGAIKIIGTIYDDKIFEMKDFMNYTIKIGRDSANNNIVISNAKVSRNHCVIRYSTKLSCYEIQDYSTNGTFLKNGERLQREKKNILLRGNDINLGETGIVIKLM